MNTTLSTADGIQLHIEDSPVANAKAAVVLTHGIGEHCSRYDHVRAAFNAAGYAFHTYDLRGHGRSSGRRVHTPSLERLLDDVALIVGRAREQSPGRNVFVYGHSMGGNITLNFALRRPAGLSGVIATSPWLVLPAPPPALIAGVARLLNRIAPEVTFQRPRDPSLLSRDPAVVAAAETDPLTSHVITARQFVELSEGAAYALAHAADLRMPLYLAHGRADAVTSMHGTQQFYEAASSADKTLNLYDGAFHELHNEIEPTRSQHLAAMIAWLDARV